MTPQPPNARQMLARAGLKAKKDWGQNFLLDQHVLGDIAEATGAGEDRPVVELGAGLGALTYHLLLMGGDVLAVERDRDLIPLLREEFAWSSKLELLEADAVRFDYATLAQKQDRPLTVVGNLPYQLSGRILVSLADAAPHVERSVVMIQREVAERLSAEPGSRTYGLLSVLVQRVFDTSLVRHVPPGAFHPPPKVHSAVVRLDARDDEIEPEVDRCLVATARAAFSARRKTLRNSIAGGLKCRPADVEAVLTKVGIDPRERAERLGVAQYRILGTALSEAGLLAQEKPEV